MTRVVIVLGLVSLLTDVSSESVQAILPLYVTAVLGLSPIAFGLIDGLHQGVSALVRLLSGWLADSTDRPKWIAFTGYALSAAARLFLLVATSLGAVAAVVTADRIGKGIRTAPRDAMISAATPTEHLGRAFGVHRALDTAGAAAGPLLAFVVLWFVPDGYATVMVLSLAFAVVGVALLGLLGPDQRLRGKLLADATAGPAGATFSWRDLGNRRLRPLLAVSGGLGLLTIGDGFVYLVLLAGGGFGVEWFPLLFVGTNLAYLLLAVPVGLLSDRVGRARVMVLGHLSLVGAYGCATLAGVGVLGIVGALSLLGLFYAATDGQVPALAGRLVPSQSLTSGIAAAQTVVAVARMAAAAGFGLLWHWAGPSTALGTVAVTLAIAVAVASTQIRRLDSDVRDVVIAP